MRGITLSTGSAPSPKLPQKLSLNKLYSSSLPKFSVVFRQDGRVLKAKRQPLLPSECGSRSSALLAGTFGISEFGELESDDCSWLLARHHAPSSGLAVTPHQLSSAHSGMQSLQHTQDTLLSRRSR